MKKLSAALFAVLFLAVAILFFLLFSGNKKAKNETIADTSYTGSAIGIAFVNIDTVVFKFNMYADRRKNF
jgi:hypothetical protein